MTNSTANEAITSFSGLEWCHAHAIRSVEAFVVQQELQADEQFEYAQYRYRDRTIYWLDYSKPEKSALKDYIDQLKTTQGISRISRPCG